MDQALKSLRTTLSFFLGESIINLFPTAWLEESIVTDTQFSCTFFADQEPHPQVLSLLEEDLRGILKSNPLLKVIEMTKRGAIEYFLHKEQPLLAEQAELDEDSTFSLLKHNNFFNLYRFPPQLEGFEIANFQLLEIEILDKVEGKFLIEVVGTAFFSKEDLKKFIKHRKEWKKAKPQLELERLNWGEFLDEEILLFPKGIDVYLIIEALWREQIRKKTQLIEVMGEGYAPSIGRGVARWGEIDSLFFKIPRSEITFFAISSLQFIHETFTMMELNAEWVLCLQTPAHLQMQQWKQEVKCLTEALQACNYSYSRDPGKSHDEHPAIEIRVTDTLGEQWAGPFLRIDLGGNIAKSNSHSAADIEYSLLGSIKHLIALLAEIKKGALPKSFNKRS